MEALERASASEPIAIDVETTGVARADRIVSAGVLIGDIAHILFLRSRHRSVTNLAPDRFRAALGPLASRKDILICGHNFSFDMGMLRREGVPIAGRIRDTERLLRLLDQDRGEDGDTVKSARIDRRHPDGPRPHTYRLKDVVPQLLNVAMIDFPGAMAELPRDLHIEYLLSDLVGTRLLHDHLWGQMDESLRRYHDRLVGPLVPILTDMMESGFAADPGFIAAEVDRLGELARRISDQHRTELGVPLGMDAAGMSLWLFGTLGMVPDSFRYKAGRRLPSLDKGHLKLLRSHYGAYRRIARSLDLILAYRKTCKLLSQLASLADHVADSGRIHTSLADRQATGRITSRNPNLQQLAKATKIDVLGEAEVIRCRDALVAAPGYELAAFDIAQADIRSLAASIEHFPLAAEAHLEALKQERLAQLGPLIAPYRNHLPALYNPAASGGGAPTAQADPFDPARGCKLAADFRAASEDIYRAVAARILDRPARDISAEVRNEFKIVTLGLVNGQGASTLARQLGCDKERARVHLEVFRRAYDDVDAFTRMIYDQIALTGRTATYLGRPRTNTAQRLMVARHRVEIMVSFREGDIYWLDVTPIQPRRRVLTCWIHRAWDAKYGPYRGELIYDAALGPLKARDYRLYRWQGLQYKLPARNLSWRSIRRVRDASEEAQYEGFDATARSLFNHICQGGTADLSKVMMTRAAPYCRWIGARLLMQIHDELVFEVPAASVDAFIRTVWRLLELPPCRGFPVPILVEPKRGVRFGSLRKVKRDGDKPL
jgi:DNA polymerase-1